jgi:hypothetical protein
MSLRRSSLILAVLFVAAAPAPAQRGKAGRHESEAGRYRAQFPNKPKTETKELALGGGQTATVTTDRSDGPSSQAVFAVTYTDYPETFREVPAKTILDGVRDGLKGADGKVTKDEEVSLGDGPDRLSGREFRVVAGSKVIHARVFLHGRRLYQVMVTEAKDAVRASAIEDFFRSFEIVK